MNTFPKAFVNPITINRLFFNFEMKIAPLQTPLSKWELQFWSFTPFFVCKFPPPKLMCPVCCNINRRRSTNASESYLDWLFKLSKSIWVHSKAELLNFWYEGLSLNTFYLIWSQSCKEKWHWMSPLNFFKYLNHRLYFTQPRMSCL